MRRFLLVAVFGGALSCARLVDVDECVAVGGAACEGAERCADGGGCPDAGVDDVAVDAGRTQDAGHPSDGGAVADADGGTEADGGSSADGGASDAGAAASQKGVVARAIVADGGRLVDVRSADEYEASHIEGARNLPLDELAGRLGELEPKHEWVVVYCRSGNRSAQAAATLRDGGFLQVFDLGPMTNW